MVTPNRCVISENYIDWPLPMGVVLIDFMSASTD